MSPLPSSDLELKAAVERERLHASVLELRSCMLDSLDVERHAGEHLGWISCVAALVGLAAGYATTGFFVRRRDA